MIIHSPWKIWVGGIFEIYEIFPPEGLGPLGGISHNFESIKENLKTADLFYESSFPSIKKIPIGFRFSILVARRVYRKIGQNILNKKSIENYNNSGKIYVANSSKIIQTLLSFFDLVRLSLIKDKDNHRYKEHQLINEEIDLNERL